jgi:hypothetical protein
VHICPVAFLRSSEAGAITMDPIVWTQRLHHRENKSKKKIARITGLPHNTLAKSSTGRLVYHSAALLKIYVYGYLNRTQKV